MSERNEVRYYGGFRLEIDDYKENGTLQFTLDTTIPFIDTNLDFASPEAAFTYAEILMRIEFSKLLQELSPQVLNNQESTKS